jgi:hypothetical protein
VGDIVQKARDAESLTARVQRLLPADLAAHLVGVRLDDGCLVLMADSSAWAARLKYHARDLMIPLREVCDAELLRTRVRVHRGFAV